MKTKKKNIPKLILFFVCTVVIFTIILTSLIMVRNSSDYFSSEAEAKARELVLEASNGVTKGAAAVFSDVELIASEVRSVSGFEATDAFGEEKVSKYGFSSLQFINDNGVEYRYGEGVGDFNSDEVQQIIKSGKTSGSDIFNDMSLGTPCVAVYSPVSGNPDITGVLAYREAYGMYSATDEIDKSVVRFYALIQPDGKIFGTEQYIDEYFAKDVSHNAFTYLMNVSENKEQMDTVVSGAAKSIPVANPLTIEGEDYVVATAPVVSSGAELLVICVFERHSLLTGTYSLYDKLLVVVGLLILTTVVTIVTSIIVKKVNEHRVAVIDEMDPVLGCNTFNKFSQEAQNIVASNKYSKFAICYMTMKNYASFAETFDKQTMDETLVHISTILKKSLSANETYGHMVEDRFVYMIHYTDIRNLSDKIKIINALISYFDKLKTSNFTLSMLTGVFLTKESNVAGNIEDYEFDLADCVNRAKIACLAHAKAYEKPFIIYDSTIGSAYVEDAKIEGKMEEALENKDFRLFFQPKYNISQNNIDSAEVLVRWYDEATKTYKSPISFIRIFETNGFIIKLDHFVFRESCVFLKEMNETGQKIVPLSINVSRVTAIEPDFLEFYRTTKEEFGIADEIITLEFTETFAYDSYTTLSELVVALKSYGFLCSIDDFGVGYSALNILKELPVDEVKVDKELLQVGNDPQKDKVILEGIFKMANGLGLKLIQEGVETKEELDYIHKLGCNVIQGYYYSKPLFMTDYIDFINDSQLNKMLKS